MRRVIDESGSPGPCVTPSELTDYLQNGCEPDRRELIQAHLIACDECREALRDLASFAAAESPSAPQQDVERKWKEFRKRIHSEERKRDWRWLTSFQPVFSTACAVAAFLSLGWGLLLQQKFSGLQVAYSTLARQQSETMGLARRFESEVAALRAPQVNLPVFDAPPAGSAERSGGERQPNVFTLPASGRFALLLSGAARQANAEYSIAIRNERGDQVFSSQGLKPDYQGNLVITFDRGFLQAGRYSVEAGERTQKGFATVATYAIRLTLQQ
jgi:hypothetical protein